MYVYVALPLCLALQNALIVQYVFDPLEKLTNFPERLCDGFQSWTTAIVLKDRHNCILEAEGEEDQYYGSCATMLSGEANDAHTMLCFRIPMKIFYCLRVRTSKKWCVCLGAFNSKRRCGRAQWR